MNKTPSRHTLFCYKVELHVSAASCSHLHAILKPTERKICKIMWPDDGCNRQLKHVAIRVLFICDCLYSMYKGYRKRVMREKIYTRRKRVDQRLDG